MTTRTFDLLGNEIQPIYTRDYIIQGYFYPLISTLFTVALWDIYWLVECICYSRRGIIYVRNEVNLMYSKDITYGHFYPCINPCTLSIGFLEGMMITTLGCIYYNRKRLRCLRSERKTMYTIDYTYIMAIFSQFCESLHPPVAFWEV